MKLLQVQNHCTEYFIHPVQNSHINITIQPQPCETLFRINNAKKLFTTHGIGNSLVERLPTLRSRLHDIEELMLI